MDPRCDHCGHDKSTCANCGHGPNDDKSENAAQEDMLSALRGKGVQRGSFEIARREPRRR